LNAYYYVDNRTAGDAAAKIGFEMGIPLAGNVSWSFGRIWSESSLAVSDEIHDDEISEVDERRHRTNRHFWRATLRKHL